MATGVKNAKQCGAGNYGVLPCQDNLSRTSSRICSRNGMRRKIPAAPRSFVRFPAKKSGGDVPTAIRIRQWWTLGHDAAEDARSAMENRSWSVLMILRPPTPGCSSNGIMRKTQLPGSILRRSAPVLIKRPCGFVSTVDVRRPPKSSFTGGPLAVGTAASVKACRPDDPSHTNPTTEDSGMTASPRVCRGDLSPRPSDQARRSPLPALPGRRHSAPCKGGLSDLPR